MLPTFVFRFLKCLKNGRNAETGSSNRTKFIKTATEATEEAAMWNVDGYKLQIVDVFF